MDNSRWLLEVHAEGSSIFVGIRDRKYGAWFIKTSVPPPVWWEVLIRRSWEDKVAASVKTVVKQVQDLDDIEKYRKDIVAKFNTDVGNNSGS